MSVVKLYTMNDQFVLSYILMTKTCKLTVILISFNLLLYAIL